MRNLSIKSLYKPRSSLDCFHPGFNKFPVFVPCKLWAWVTTHYAFQFNRLSHHSCLIFHWLFKLYVVYTISVLFVCLFEALHKSLVMRNPVFGVPDQVRHKPDCTATEDSYKLEISDLGSR